MRVSRKGGDVRDREADAYGTARVKQARNTSGSPHKWLDGMTGVLDVWELQSVTRLCRRLTPLRNKTSTPFAAPSTLRGRGTKTDTMVSWSAHEVLEARRRHVD